uniref:Glycerate kinase n=1 Tax=Panagrellus redivivus TaxID=6233 RepID=A0A7E4UVP2_PANRE
MASVFTKKSFSAVYASFEKAFTHALQKLSPERSVQAALQLNGRTLHVRNQAYALKHAAPIHVIAFGKAAASMIVGAEAALGDAIAGGIASVPIGTVTPKASKIQYYPGAENNIPDAAAVSTTARIEEYLKALSADEIVLFLVSGGGSALLSAPIDGLSLEEKQDLIKALSSNGATIQELNIVRIALSRVKGGKLTRLVKGKGIALIISDIIDDPIELVASGPTVVSHVPEGKTLETAVEIAERRLGDKLDSKIRKLLERGQKDVPASAPQIQNEIVASNGLFVTALVEQLRSIDPSILATVRTTNYTGDATATATIFFKHAVDEIRAAAHNDTPQWHLEIFAGETTVIFPESGAPKEAKGGRNQEMALAFLYHLIVAKQNEHFNGNVGLIAVGTDGQDGPTDAAGAFVSSVNVEGRETAELATLIKTVEDKLLTKDSYAFWNAFHGGQNHIRFGKTGHNLMDVYVIAYLI